MHVESGIPAALTMIERDGDNVANNSRRLTASGGNTRYSSTFRRRLASGYYDRCNPAVNKRPARRGFALLLVLVFVVLFLAMLGVAWRQIGAVLRIESARARQMTRDDGSLLAVAKALRLLETTSDLSLIGPSYRFKTTIDGEDKWYTVTFSHDSDWTVTAIAVPGPTEDADLPPILPLPQPP